MDSDAYDNGNNGTCFCVGKLFRANHKADAFENQAAANGGRERFEWCHVQERPSLTSGKGTTSFSIINGMSNLTPFTIEN